MDVPGEIKLYPKKIPVENIQHLKRQSLLTLAGAKSTQQNTDFEIQNPQRYSADACLLICQVRTLAMIAVKSVIQDKIYSFIWIRNDNLIFWRFNCLKYDADKH